MFRIIYDYFKVNAWLKPIGTPYVGYVDGKTIKQVNNAFQHVRDNHDLSKYTPTEFWKVEEIGVH